MREAREATVASIGEGDNFVKSAHIMKLNRVYLENAFSVCIPNSTNGAKATSIESPDLQKFRLLDLSD